MTDIRKIGVIGAGQMGNGIAHVVALAGYNVVVNRVGGTPLEQATVVAVRPGQTFSRTDSGNPGDSLQTTVTSKTVYVDVK